MQDQKFDIYYENGCSLSGSIENGCLCLLSEIDDEEGYWGVKEYNLSREDTAKLFKLISLEEFIAFCRVGRLTGMENFFVRHRIKYHGKKDDSRILITQTNGASAEDISDAIGEFLESKEG